MKSFEEWYNKKLPLPHTTERGPVGRAHKQGCKDSWRAALNWVLNQPEAQLPLADPYNFDFIREELSE